MLPDDLYRLMVATYPGLDVKQCLHVAQAWLVTNPRRRKTKRGMPRFINNWLSRQKPLSANQRFELEVRRQGEAYERQGGRRG